MITADEVDLTDENALTAEQLKTSLSIFQRKKPVDVGSVHVGRYKTPLRSLKAFIMRKFGFNDDRQAC
jgi:hypothetical protein